MHSFLVCINLQGISPKLILDKASTITKKLLPQLGTEFETFQRHFAEINGGWFYLTPPLNLSEQLISDYVDDHFAILAYGEIFRSGRTNTAELVLNAWQKGGIDEVRQLDGSFSAVIIDMKLRRVYILSDLLGSRSLRYFKHKESLFISNQDIPIVATGLCPVEFNLTSACSIAAFDWSLGGESLLKHIKTCHPNEYISWNNGVITQTHKSLLNSKNRSETENQLFDNRNIDQIIAYMQKCTRELCNKEETVNLHLTAGQDTRSLLGIILSVVQPYKITAQTLGERNCLDARIAQQLANKYSFRHDILTPDIPKLDSFLTHSRLKAFLMNGETDSRRAVWALPEINGKKPPRFNGSGGEIFRFDYSSNDPVAKKKALCHLTQDDVLRILTNKPLCRIYILPWISSEIQNTLFQKLKYIIISYYNIFSHGAEILNLFYLHERLSRWGSMVERWQCRRGEIITLFKSPRLIKLGFELSLGARANCLLARTIIRRFLPDVYWWPINWGFYLSKPSKIRILKNYIYSAPKGLPCTLRKMKNSVVKSSRNIAEIQSNLFIHPLGGLIHDMLLSEGSFALVMFGRNNLKKMLEDHIFKKANNIDVLGPLVTIEQWRNLVMQASLLSKNCKY